MEKAKKIYRHNFWHKKTDEHVKHTVQFVLGLSKSKDNVAASSCGSGSCNCGGGCNGECSTSCEGGN